MPKTPKHNTSLGPEPVGFSQMKQCEDVKNRTFHAYTNNNMCILEFSINLLREGYFSLISPMSYWWNIANSTLGPFESLGFLPLGLLASYKS